MSALSLTLPPAWTTPLTEGATVPDVLLKLRVRDLTSTDQNPFVWKDLQTADLFQGKRFVIFSLPGAYTPLCSSEMLPGYLKHYGITAAAAAMAIVCYSLLLCVLFFV